MQREGNGRVASLSSLVSGRKTRKHDFLRGLTMKIRFMKRLTTRELDQHLLADDGKIVFTSCDEVQMRLTKLELSGVRLITSSDSVGKHRWEKQTT